MFQNPAINIKTTSGERKGALIPLKGHTGESLYEKIMIWFSGRDIEFDFIGFPDSIDTTQYTIGQLIALANLPDSIDPAQYSVEELLEITAQGEEKN